MTALTPTNKPPGRSPRPALPSRFLPLLVSGLLLLAPFIVSPMPGGPSAVDAASTLLAEGEAILAELQAAGLPALKVEDLLLEATEYAEAQRIIAANGGTPDFTKTERLIAQLRETRIAAFSLHDELKALDAYLAEQEGIDLTVPRALRDEATKEYAAERFSSTKPLIDRSYEAVNELHAASTKAKAFYDATTKTLEAIIRAVWKPVLVVGAFLFLLFLLFRQALARFRIGRRLRHLERERTALQRLLEETQRAYFDEQTLSEGEYRIRTRKYGEMLRDLNRQFPLLQERLVMTRSRRKSP